MINLPPSILKETSRQFIAFSGVGVIGTAVHYSVLMAFVELLTIDPVIGSIAGYVVGAVVNYTLNYHFTFKSDACHRTAGPKFFFIVLIGFCINTSVMFVLVNSLVLNYILSQVISTGLVLFWNFFGSKYWVFKERKIIKTS